MSKNSVTESLYDVYNDVIRIKRLLDSAYEILDDYSLYRPEKVEIAKKVLKSVIELIGKEEQP